MLSGIHKYYRKANLSEIFQKSHRSPATDSLNGIAKNGTATKFVATRTSTVAGCLL